MCGALVPVNPHLHQPTLRALLRRKDLDEEGVASLLELLALPLSVVGTLRASHAPEQLPGVELVEQSTPRRAVAAAMRSDWASRSVIRTRPLYLTLAIGTALAAFVCLAVTVLGVAVLVTHGSVIDHTGACAEDRVFVGVFALLTVILTPTAVHRLRRSRERR